MMQTMHLILGMSGMKALVTAGAISEFAGENRNELLHTAGIGRPALVACIVRYQTQKWACLIRDGGPQGSHRASNRCPVMNASPSPSHSAALKLHTP
jgi:hypothetical protein